MSDGASAVPLAQISVKDQGKIYLKKKKNQQQCGYIPPRFKSHLEIVNTCKFWVGFMNYSKQKIDSELHLYNEKTDERWFHMSNQKSTTAAWILNTDTKPLMNNLQIRNF